MNAVVLAVIVVAGIGLLLGAGLTAASAFLDVPADGRVQKIREALPGANCGACGYSGCDAYAEAAAFGEASGNACIPGGDATASAVALICGSDAGAPVMIEAFVKCGGSCENTQPKFHYEGAQSCAAASMLFAGPESCAFSCLGFGDCISACAYGALSVRDGLARVNSLLCVGCGKCAAVCPKQVIEMVPVQKSAYVRCSNTDRGAAANAVCKVSCIACKRCEKKCPEQAITVQGDLAGVDFGKCTGCGACAEVCPKGCISIL